MPYAIKVVQKNGDEDFLCVGYTDIVAKFPSRAAAQKQKDFMLIGMEDEVQSINIVKYPAKKAAS